ncbi:MAG: putative Phosphomannomutase [Promethearchaeota archaeon]|nr:MAG: putative Phosphomannomutase [Candidatus Lokiarchaeota archaeon]
MNNIAFEVEELTFKKGKDNTKILVLPELTEEEKDILDPIIAPTSGLRIQIYDKQESDENIKFILRERTMCLFLRFFKAISIKFQEMSDEKNPKMLIFTDDRPSSQLLLNYGSKIFAFDGYQIILQEDEPNNSRVSAPYGAASVALYNDADLAIVITASHNELVWNGIKFYIEYPIPISGNIFKEISKIALKLEEIPVIDTCRPLIRNVIQKNNDYIKELLSHILEIKSLKGKDLVIWPYLGKARGIVELFKQLGAKVHVIDEPLDPPNPIKIVKEEKLQEVMSSTNSEIALLLDADRDRIALYIHENGKYSYYIPNEIYSAMHNILARHYNKKILNVRTIPSDLRGDESSFLNILTGVGYKHLGIILYFLLDIEIEKSKVETAILYMQEDDGRLIQIKKPLPLKKKILTRMKEESLTNTDFIFVMWEESGGHTITVINAQRNEKSGEQHFTTELPIIADKYPVPALVLITELLCRGHIISESIDWSIKGINQTIEASDKEKVRIMKNFQKEDGKRVNIEGKIYDVTALNNSRDKIKIYQLKSDDSTLYFRPSGTGPDIRFYIFGNRDTYLEEIERVKKYIKKEYI